MKSQIHIYKDQIINNLCKSLTDESEKWLNKNDNNFVNNDVHYIREDGILLTIDHTRKDVYIYDESQQHRVYFPIEEKKEKQKVIEAVAIMLENKKLTAESELLKKMNVATRKDKLDNLKNISDD